MWDPVWEKVFTTQPWGRYPGEDLIRFVARNFYNRPVRADTRFLEVGFGTGANLWFLAREGFSSSGIEGSPAAAALARERLDKECPGWDKMAPDNHIEIGDMVHLPWPDESFDALIDSEAVYCNDFDESRQIYADMHRVARPGARLFVRTFAKDSWGDGVGELTGHRRYVAVSGPLAGKGMSRFTDRDELGELLGNWRIDEVNLITRTWDAGGQTIREWIVEAHKDQA